MIESLPILLVDDRPDDVVLTVRMLRRAHVGNEVRVASDGADALAYLATTHPVLILMALKLPGMSGAELLARLRADAVTRTVPVVVLSSEAAEADAALAATPGPHVFVRKPFAFADLAHALGRLRLSLALTDGPAAPGRSQDLANRR